MDKMTIQILRLNNMVATNEFNRQNGNKFKEQTIIEVNELKQEMHKTKAKTHDLLKRSKDLDPTYVKNRLEEYDDLVKYYSILCTKQQMNDANVEFDEWWELVEFQFHEEMHKKLATHKRDEVAYRRLLSTFKKTFPNFIYHNLNHIGSSNLVQEEEEVKYNGTFKDIQQEEPQKLKGGGHDILIEISKSKQKQLQFTIGDNNHN